MNSLAKFEVWPSKRLIMARRRALWQESYSEYGVEWVMRRGLEMIELKYTMLGKPLKTYYGYPRF